MYTSSVPALISKNVGNTLTNFKTWGSIMINVKDYGAKGDGGTNDTAAIQAAINYANSIGGATVFFPPGTYIVSAGGVEMKSNVYAVGAGRDFTTIKGTDFVIGTYNAYENMAVMNLTAESAASSVDAFTIYFFKNTNTDPTSLGGNKVMIYNCIAKNACSSAIITAAYHNVHIEQCVAVNAGENAIEVQSFANGNAINYATIINCEVQGWARERSGSGIAVFGRVDNLTMANNRVDGTGFVNALRGISIDHNIGSGPTVTIGALGVCANNSIRGCTVGIQDLISRMIFNGNRISNTTGGDVLMGTGQYFNNYYEATTENLAFGSSPLVTQADKAVQNHVNGPRVRNVYNLLKNGGFASFASGESVAPDQWTQSGTGVVTKTATVPPFGKQTTSVNANAAVNVQLFQAVDISKVKGHMLYASAWVKSSSASAARIMIRTSGGDFYGDYAPTGGTEWVRVVVGCFVSTGDAQASVWLTTDAAKTVEWCGVWSGIDDLVNYSGDESSLVLNPYTANAADTPIQGTVRVFNVAGVYKIGVYMNGAWRYATLT